MRRLGEVERRERVRRVMGESREVVEGHEALWAVVRGGGEGG